MKNLIFPEEVHIYENVRFLINEYTFMTYFIIILDVFVTIALNLS